MQGNPMSKIPEGTIENQIIRLGENIDFESKEKAREAAIAYIDYLTEQVNSIGGTIAWPEKK
jgi:hypothetical protein